MSKLIDLTGKRFNNLVVVRRAENAKGGVARWECICDCGNTTIVRGSNLKSGGVKSCGCLKFNADRPHTHLMSQTRLYRIWASIKTRCFNEHEKAYKNYGGRGITMCAEWKDSFENFYQWAIGAGYNEELTIERIDTNGNYCPENCTWIPGNEQQGNRRICYSIEINGETKNLVDWCNELGVPYNLAHNRINKLGWSYEKALTEPVHAEKRNKANGRIHK